MNCEEALLVVDKAIFAKADRHLNDAEVTIFRGSWEGQTYDEMAEKSGYQANYLKGDAGHKFWKLLSEVLEEPVGKRNFRAAVERARSRFPLETGSNGRSPFGAVLESQEAKQEKRIERIEEDSVILVLKSSPERFERIKDLFKSGQLTEVSGIPVKDVRLEKAAVVNLSQWLENVFEKGWQTVEAILGTKALQPVSRFRDENSEIVAIRTKLIDLGMQLADALAVAMVVGITREADDKIGIVIRVCSTKQQSYLPPGLQLIVLDESEATFAETHARQGDNWLQHEFQGNPGERFSIKVAIGDVSFQEYFAI